MSLPRVIVTRPRTQAAGWVGQLEAAGLEAVALPLIDIAAPPDPQAVSAAWQALPTRRMVMFVSPTAAAGFFRHQPAGAPWPAGVRAAGTGPGTVSALREHGVPPAQIVSPPPTSPQFDSEALWRLLSAEDWRGAEVLIVRGADDAGDDARGAGRDWLTETWRAAGARVSHVAAYRRGAPVLDAGGQALLEQARQAPQAHAWLFSSSQAVQHLVALFGGAVPPGVLAVATHPRIAEAAQHAGFARVVQAAPQADAIAQAVRGLTNGPAPATGVDTIAPPDPAPST